MDIKFYIGIISTLLAFSAGVISALAKLHVKRLEEQINMFNIQLKQEKENRERNFEELAKLIKDLSVNLKEEKKELVELFKEDLGNEKLFRNELITSINNSVSMMSKNISELYDKINNKSEQLRVVEGKICGIENLCHERHNK